MHITHNQQTNYMYKMKPTMQLKLLENVVWLKSLLQWYTIEQNTRPSEMEVYHRDTRNITIHKWPNEMILDKGNDDNSIT